MLLFVNCIFAVLAIQTMQQHTPTAKTFTPKAISDSDMEMLLALDGTITHRASIKRWREHQVHLAKLRANRNKVRVAESAPAVPTNSVWDEVAGCESSGNWQDTAGFYEGGLQFDPRTWDDNKFPGYPDHAYEATREQQIAVAEKVLADSTWAQQWPACSLKLGLR